VRLASNSRFLFFCGWFAWWLACWFLIAAEYFLRAQQWLTPYGIEAWLAMVTPLAVFAAADQLVMLHYERTWEAFTTKALCPMVLEKENLDRLRHDLRRSILLRWFAPRQSRTLRGQLTTAADWLPALTSPQHSMLVRYRETVLGLVLFLLLLVCFLMAWLSPSRSGVTLAVIPCAISLIGFGYQMVKIAARRQAVFDYFSAWRARNPEDLAA
jgi:hypothetical protein